MDEYVTSSDMPSLPLEGAEALELPITTEELVAALKDSKPHKAPGLDGLTLLYYSEFFSRLAGQFLRAYNFL